MELIDTHCHIHEATLEGLGEQNTKHKWIKAGSPKPDDIIARAKKAGVEKMICVGTTLTDSELAVQFVLNRKNLYASIGIHPHEAKDHKEKDLEKLDQLAIAPRVIAVGEIGLDYYYEHSPKKVQREIFIKQLEIAQKHDLPVIFHVREAFGDLFAVLSDFKGVRGVIHSFTANTTTLDKTLNLGLYIGLNGIMTFTKDDYQLEAAKAVPLNRLLLETDSPFLTPKPHRGKICEPEHLVDTAKFLADLRLEKLAEIEKATTKNAIELFKL